MSGWTWTLRGAPLPPSVAPALDASQRAVVDHAGGPLLVLAGPGTGKTTTLVEAVIGRVRRGLRPDQVLVLTFSRKAASELRDRITARLATTTAAPAAWTFHAFCYALLRDRQDPLSFAAPLRLLSGPEQDVAVRELMLGSLAEGTVVWPGDLRPALATRGFADEVRAVLARAREAGLDPGGLADIATRAGRSEWQAVAAFFSEYLDVLDAQGALDYAELAHRAGLLARQPEVQAGLRARYGAVFVDEYQDTDPAQEVLLRALAGDGRDLVVVGDPDQSIYGFRGADVAGLLRFRDRFPRADGAPAPVLTLACSRRAGPVLLAASRAVAERISLPGLPADAVRSHRSLEPSEDLPAGAAEIRIYPSVGVETEAIADLLRRAHLEHGLPWRRMAVLVRSGVRAIPLLRRVLGTAGVPLEVAGDELPLVCEPAVAPLLLALRCAADRAALTAERARALLLSPLGGADATDLRRLGRALREQERKARRSGGGPGRASRPSAELLREAVDTPDVLVGVRPDVAAPARRVGRLLAAARARLDGGGTPADALWAIWSGSDWPRRLEETAYAGAVAGRQADRDLDAVVALFDTASRSEDRRAHRGVLPLLAELEAQQIPGDTLAERAVRGDGVRVLTAHRSKGLEWDLVVVPGVQEGVWPDLRRRGSLLEADRLGAGGLREPPSPGSLLAEERRLFYVAVTRARARLVVTAVDSPEEDGERPSRFLAELGVPPAYVRTRVRRPLSLPGLVAELRCVNVDPARSPALRRAAAARLARLAAARGDHGEPLVPAAHPDRWWGMLERTEAPGPLHDPGDPVPLSGTSLASLERCPLRWFLDHEVHAQRPTSVAMGFGSLLHTLADEVAGDRTPADLDVLLRRLDRVWGQLAFEAPWQSRQQREEARSALERFLRWQTADRRRRLLGTEHDFDVRIDLAEGSARLRGSMDRVELDDEGRVHVVDFKTGRAAPGRREVVQQPQLGVYQLAVRAGALRDLPGLPSGPVSSGGAELVQLRIGRGGPVVQAQPPLPTDGEQRSWIEDLLGTALTRILAEDYPPLPNPSCRRCDFRRCCPGQPDGRQVVE